MSDVLHLVIYYIFSSLSRWMLTHFFLWVSQASDYSAMGEFKEVSLIVDPPNVSQKITGWIFTHDNNWKKKQS